MSETEVARLRLRGTELEAELARLRDGDGAVAEAQRADAEFLRSVLAASADCIKVLDLDARLIFMSEQGQRVMEVSDFNDIRGCPWPDFWTGAGYLAACAAVETARQGGIGHFQGPAPTLAGSPRWWDVQVTPIRGRDGRPEKLLSVSRDITAARKAEEALRQVQVLNTLILNSSRDCIVVLDLEGNTLFVSPGGLEAMEVSDAAAIIGLSWLRVWQGADHEAAAAAVAAARDGGTGWFQGFCPTHAGTPKWWDVVISPLAGPDGRPERLVSVGRDITAGKQAEAALHETNATLERRVDERTRERDRAWKSSRDLQAVVGANGIIRAVNDAWTTLLGWRPDEIVGRSHLDLNHPDHREPSQRAQVAAISDELTPYETRCLHKDGSFRWISWVAAPEDGLIYASGRHITVEKEAANALETMQGQLRQSQKMEAVGQLTGGLAHDFNNLLTGITGSLELMRTRLSQGRVEDVDRYITAAQGAARRAAALTHRLLAFSRRQTLAPEATDINGLVAEMQELIGRTIGPAIQLDVRPASGLWTTLVDPNQLENALLNLCINARDAMPDGGRLTITTANSELTDPVGPEHELAPGHYVCLTVIDTGTGMQPEVMQRAFEPFFTTKPLGEGTGLGLSMIYGFARQSGGQVRIASKLGDGTSVSLYLPRHLGDLAVPTTPPPAHDDPAPGRGETVLVVDDEPMIRMIVTEVLRRLGYKSIEAADGAEGVRVLQSAERIDLLITDVGLPGGMNGPQVAEAGRLVRPNLKVLFITGYAESATRNAASLDAGMQLLAKPFSLASLAARVNEMIAAG